VLHLIATLDLAGAEKQLVYLCRGLDRAEFDPAVCCLTRGGPLEADLQAACVPVHILGKRSRWDVRALFRVMRAIRDFQPDILHTWLPTANTLGRVAGIASGVPVLIASERARDAWKGKVWRKTDRILAKRTTRIVTNAGAVRQFLVSQVGLPAEKLRLVRNGLDFREFDAASARGPSDPLPDPEGRLVVGNVGRLEEQKGTAYLLDAFARLPRDLTDVRLWIVGDGPDGKDLRVRAARLKVEERVRFMGVRQDVPALMARFDLFVLPSLWEGLPNVVIEAMAARRAVVATNVDGTPEAVAHGWTGLLVPPANPAALAQAIERLLHDPAMRQKFGAAGRRKAEEMFGLRRMIAETQDVYREALAEALSGES